MSAIGITFEKNKLTCGNLSKIFPDNIEQVLVTHSGILVLFEFARLRNENIFLLNPQLNVIWQIQALDIQQPNRPFTSIWEEGGKFMAYNATGWECEIDLKEGRANGVLFVK